MHPAYEYAGEADTTREAPNVIKRADIYRRTRDYFSSSTVLRNTVAEHPKIARSQRHLFSTRH
jgi:hypothetical protein